MYKRNQYLEGPSICSLLHSRPGQARTLGSPSTWPQAIQSDENTGNNIIIPVVLGKKNSKPLRM